MRLSITFVLAFFPAIIFTETDILAESSSESPPTEVVVTANRIDTPKEQVSSSVTVISSDEIQESKQNQIEDILRTVPGVDVVRSGSLGGNTTVFLRGANSEHTLFLIDGIEANNPITTARSFNFSDFTLDNIERIEVLRGPQSTLYGSDALGGVINVITKKGKGPASVTVSADGGSHNTFSEKAGVSGGDDLINYSLGFSHQESTGISSADKSLGNSERDGFNGRNFSGRLGFTLSESAEVNLFLRDSDSTSDLDNEGGAGGDDLNRALQNSTLLSRAEFKTKFLDDKVSQTYGVSWTDHDFRDDNDPDTLSADFQRSSYHGGLLKFDLQNNISITDSVKGVLGLETEQERGDSTFSSVTSFGPFDDRFSEEKARSNGYYLELQGAFDNWYPVAGLRVDDHSGLSPYVTWKVGQSYLIRNSGTKIFATYGTGFKAPSLFELHSSYGNPDLDPERSSGVDGGIEQSIFNDTTVLGLTYFYNDFNHLITFDPNSFKFSNIASARTQGLETSLSIAASDSLKIRGAYTLLDTHDVSTGEELLRRARNKASVEARYQFINDALATISFDYIGKRDDNDFSTFPANRVALGGYCLVNLVLSYDVIPGKLQIYSRINNLFDHKYQEVYGFGTTGITAIGGIKVSL